MRDALLLAIDEAINRDGSIYKSAADRHKDKPQNTINFFIEQELANYVAPAVMNEPLLKNKANLMIRIGDEGGGMTFTHRAVYLLLTWANEIGSAKAVHRLRKLLSMKEAIGYHVEALAGLDVKSPTRLANNVKLIPFDQLPSSPQKSKLMNRRYEYLEFGFMQGASAALTIKTKVKPLFYEEHSAPEIRDPGLYRDILNTTRLCLGLVGQRALVRLNGWFQYNDELLESASGAGGISYPSSPYHANFNIPTPQEFDPKKAVRITRAYCALSKNSSEIVTRAIQRLDKAMCDRHPGDAAIDLSIAFETLTTDPGGQGEHTWKVGLRSALLLGGSLDSQEKTRRAVKDIYDFRSRVVHEGHIPNTRLAAATSAVMEGTAICAHIIARTILRGRLPNDWSKFELSGGKAY